VHFGRWSLANRVEPFTDRLQQGLDKAADEVVALIDISSFAQALVHVDMLDDLHHPQEYSHLIG
jgi:hypothetical protein